MNGERAWRWTRYGVAVGATNRDEEELTGGNASASVLRIGSTVRKPWLPLTERTIAYMRALRDRGIDIPEPRGRDDEGRLVLDYISGELAMDQSPLDTSLLHSIGALVRTIHDASAGLPVPGAWEVLLPADSPDLLCHNDLTTWNLIIDGERLVSLIGTARDRALGSGISRMPRSRSGICFPTRIWTSPWAASSRSLRATKPMASCVPRCPRR